MMNEWIISSSLLIAGILVGRRLLRGRISLRLQYALWLAVLVRLLLPVQLFTSPIGAGSIAEDVDISAPVRQVYTAARNDDYQREYDAAYSQVVAEYEARNQTVAPDAIDKMAYNRVQQNRELDLTRLLYGAWFAGMAVMTSVIVSCNVHLGLHLRRRRWELPTADSLLPVYVTEVVPTPCIFGFFHPAIYLTPEAAGDERVRRHALTHELTHYRHLDHIWSVLRSVCLVLHWYNPLVWMAARVSRADAELACDEGALAKLGEEHRADYGRTLIGLTCADHGGSVFVTATTMTGSARSITERIKLLMKRPRNTVLALTAVVLIGSIIVGCTFAGAPETTEPAETTIPEETIQPTEPEPEFGTIAYFEDLLNPQLYRSEADWYPRALTSFYDDPAKMDLYLLFYAGIPGADNTPGTEELAYLEGQSTYEPGFDLVRIPAQEMDRVLTQYFGVTLAETDRIGLENFIYNEKTDCYYHSQADTNLSFREVIACEELEDGLWRVSYTPEYGDSGVVTLCLVDENWKIISNQPVESTPEDYSYQAAEVRALFDTNADPWYLSALTVLYSHLYDIDAATYFCNGLSNAGLTAEERALIVETYGEAALDKPIFRMTYEEMNEVLVTYLDLDVVLADTSGFLFCPETRAFLRVKEENTTLAHPNIISCEALAEKKVQMIYTFPGSDQRYVATLQKRDNWIVHSNQLLIEKPLNARELTEEEIEQFRTAFGITKADGETNPAACFFVGYYADITEMERKAFLYNFPIAGEGTEEDFQLLKKKYPDVFELEQTIRDMNQPIHSYETKDLNEVLLRYAGIRWEDLADDGTHYLEETGRWYNYTSDFGLGGFYAQSGYVYDGGAVVCDGWSAVFLTERNGNYCIQAHLPAIAAEG